MTFRPIISWAIISKGFRRLALPMQNFVFLTFHFSRGHFFKNGQFLRPILLYFRLFKHSWQLLFNIIFWQWLDSNCGPLDQKRPLYQLSHHCPNRHFLKCFIFIFLISQLSQTAQIYKWLITNDNRASVLNRLQLKLWSHAFENKYILLKLKKMVFRSNLY